MLKTSSVPLTTEWETCFNLLLEDAVSELTINGPDKFFMKRNGKRSHIDNIVLTEEQYKDGIAHVLSKFVKSTDDYKADSYLFEGRLEFEKNGKQVRGRCHVVLPPASDYPQITIAKKTASLTTIDAIASAGSMTTEMLAFLKDMIRADITFVISGQTGAGKTTMLEALSKYVSNDIRIGVAEDVPELILSQSNVSYLNSTPWAPGVSRNDVATLDWVVKQFQRMRTDKLIVGETRGEEFADFLIAANSGMDGSMTTIHANNPRSCLQKMTNFALRGSPNIPVKAINRDIATAVDIIIQLIYLPKQGKYRISHIEEVTETLGTNEDALISTQTLYKYNIENDTFDKVTNMTDSLKKKFAKKDINVDSYIHPPDTNIEPHSKMSIQRTESIRVETPDASITNLSQARNNNENRRIIPNTPFNRKI